MMENAFYFILKAIFVLKDIYIFDLTLFGHAASIKKSRVISKLMMSQSD